MRHLAGYRKLGRDEAHRRQLLRNLVRSLFTSESGQIRTTVEKAKEARRLAEKMITLGKRDGVHARRLAARYLPDRTIVRHLFDDIAPKFASRPGGYTRVLRLGARGGDNAEMAVLELVDIADAIRKSKASAEKEGKKPGKAEAKTAEETAEAQKAQAEAKRKAKEEKRAARADKAAARPDAKSKAKSAAKSQPKGRKGQ